MNQLDWQRIEDGDMQARAAEYSPISPTPCRGFVILAVRGGDSDFDINVFPIVGVVIRSLPVESSTGNRKEIVPVYLSPCYAKELSGGMYILENNDYYSLYYSVVWCEWPEEEDEARLISVKNHVAAEARLEMQRALRD